MLKKIPFTIILIITQRTFSQEIYYNKYLNNDSIKFDIVFKSKTALSNNESSGYFVKINLAKNLKNFFLRKDFDFWQLKLKDSLSDWAANVLLYSLYKREATIIHFLADFNYKDKYPIYKEDEIEYWKNFFSKKRKKNNYR